VAGLTDQASGKKVSGSDAIERAHQAWQESMLSQLKAIQGVLQSKHPGRLAADCGGELVEQDIRVNYWGEWVRVSCIDWKVRKEADGAECSIYDTGMLLYYLREADGIPMSDKWIGYRELPGGNFYSQAFQGYSGDRLAKAYGERPEDYAQAARELDGIHLDGLPGVAYAFLPLPRIHLATILYPGDEEFAARASVLFDAAASHYMTTDGLALLGAGLVGRLIQKKERSHKG
jgi:hypothetical protein